MAAGSQSLSLVYARGDEYATEHLPSRVDEIQDDIGRSCIDLITIRQSESLRPLADRVERLRLHGEVATMSDIDNTLIKQRPVQDAAGNLVYRSPGVVDMRSVPIIQDDTALQMRRVAELSHLYFISARPVMTSSGESYRERTSKQLTNMGFPAPIDRVWVGYGDAKAPQVNLKSKGQAIDDIIKLHPEVRSFAFQDDLKLELMDVLESAIPKLQSDKMDSLLLVHREVVKDF